MANNNNNNNNLHNIKKLIVRKMEFPHNSFYKYAWLFELCWQEGTKDVNVLIVQGEWGWYKYERAWRVRIEYMVLNVNLKLRYGLGVASVAVWTVLGWILQKSGIGVWTALIVLSYELIATALYPTAKIGNMGDLIKCRFYVMWCMDFLYWDECLFPCNTSVCYFCRQSFFLIDLV